MTINNRIRSELVPNMATKPNLYNYPIIKKFSSSTSTITVLFTSQARGIVIHATGTAAIDTPVGYHTDDWMEGDFTEYVDDAIVLSNNP